MEYDFLSPRQICFGWGRRAEVGKLARSLGRRAFVVCGSRTLAANGTIDEIDHRLTEAGIAPVRLANVVREPEVEDVDAATDRLRSFAPGGGDLVLAVGGGSAIDLAKAVAALVTQAGRASVAEYLEGVGSGLKIVARPLPLLAMSTTAGTGAEATKNAVISSSARQFKKSLRSDQMLPRIVLVDPELSASASPQVTAYSGLDAITQLIESYISSRAKPIPQALAISGLRLALPAIVAAVGNPPFPLGAGRGAGSGIANCKLKIANCELEESLPLEHGRSEGNDANRAAREAMAHAALLSGIALANSGLGLAHGVAAALGVYCRVPHGLACAVMLPVALRVNRTVSGERLAELGRATLPDEFVTAEQAADAFIQRIEQICDALQIPRRLSQLGVAAEQIPAIVEGSQGNSLDGNPRKIQRDELRKILESIL